MRAAKTLTALLVLVSVGAAPAAAETARFGVSVGYGDLSGSDYSGVGAGPTFGGEALFLASNRLFVGPAFDYSNYSVGNAGDLSQIDLDVVVRYYLPSERRLVFVGGLVGWSHQSREAGYLSAGAGGVAFGATVGLSLPLGQSSADLSFTGSYNTYGNVSVGAESIDGTNRAGTRILVRLGFGFPLGLVDD